MNIKEMRQLPDEELRTEIDKARDKVFRMRFHGKGKDLENPGQLKKMKKDIARMHTVLKERMSKRAVAAAGETAGATSPPVEGAPVKGDSEA